ncbi:MAG TPA: hypothetical protein VEX62_13750 [Candidatus Limnocylindrales bacterium]|nr:hypothetical protein [Candidatus Limnocylindrales bacterium]
MSQFWRSAYRVQYRLLALLDPLIRSAWNTFGIGNVVELRVPNRKGNMRSRLVGILLTDGRSYLGHPNGDVGWTRDLDAAGGGVIKWPNGMEWQFSARRLSPGAERERAIRATNQHPFPGNLMYRLGRRHIRAVGVFFRLEDPA